MKAPNARWTITLCAVASVLVFLHIAYSAQSNRQMLQGTFFASGILIMSGGAVYDTSLRLQSHGYKLHDFEEINKKSQDFSLTQVGSFLGGARYVTNQERGGEWIKDTISVDRDIAFNYAYYSNEFSRLSFYKIAARTGSQCFYLKELEALRCFGAEH
ncbi:hypothetical protein IFT48_25180 [Pseudomonas fluorescens]|uniref:Uncharacterized protein n=1 Tax=Pseudomonas edaphica TaxID=2006980 RepID=A0A7Y7RPQ0_9PSED|nr:MULTISPECIES: hypothetical protein [Pseudomonas]MBD8093293.1 hypothetical protein [Pseudomonas fluorescens]MBD8719246.1 hypothetical protein [Pseudomonas fluorescens]NMX56242.1 hypothetical protein [Pseudomonas sp. WS 5146]NVZ55828.1 hypothetical protein [Pseudomonas edaphica]QRR31242.1 hypothetical protein ICJ33_28640 [Pseudomonas simiae]